MMGTNNQQANGNSDAKLTEESIFGETQFDDIIEWAEDRHIQQIAVRITGEWTARGKREFIKAQGHYLKKWDGSVFPKNIYLCLTEGNMGKNNILMGRRLVKIPRPTRKGHYPDDADIIPNTVVLVNSFQRDLQDRVFFRAKDEYSAALAWLENFVSKYSITGLVEGVLHAKGKKMRCTVTGYVKKVENEEIFIEIIDAFNPTDPLNEDYKEFLTREWFVQVAQTGKNYKIHPEYMMFEIGEELAYTKQVLLVNDVKVVLGGRTIIHDVNFQLERGEILGIIGESGAGKSTTLKAILGEFDYTGDIYLFGYDARNTKKIAPYIGYIPQELSRMYGNFNALENIVSFGRQYGLSDEILIQRGKKILKDLGIEHVANQAVNSLSGGQQRRVSIAIAMVHNPRIMFLDEPTSGLDPLARYELWEYLDIINKEYGITLVVISHYLDEIEYCDRACIFLRGVGFYDFGSPDGLKAKLPGKGLAVEVTLEQVTLDAIEVLEKTEGVDFVIQRGERIRILSDLPTKKFVDNILASLKEHDIAIHSIEMKVAIDMIDYFTFVSENTKKKLEDAADAKPKAKPEEKPKPKEKPKEKLKRKEEPKAKPEEKLKRKEKPEAKPEEKPKEKPKEKLKRKEKPKAKPEEEPKEKLKRKEKPKEKPKEKLKRKEKPKAKPEEKIEEEEEADYELEPDEEIDTEEEFSIEDALVKVFREQGTIRSKKDVLDAVQEVLPDVARGEIDKIFTLLKKRDRVAYSRSTPVGYSLQQPDNS